jgi:hypothetical protein
MKTEQKYMIKYLGIDPRFHDASKKMYWFKDKKKEDWVTDPNLATLFNNPEGITEVGRLLVEHEWVTRLIPEEEVPKVKPVSPPSEDFILVVDCDGDPQEVFSGNVNLDQVFQCIDKLDRESGYHPHSAWKRTSGGFTRVFEVIGKDPK